MNGRSLFLGWEFSPAAAVFACGVLLVFVCAPGCERQASLDASTASVKHITQGEFAEQVTPAAGPVVVEFYASWCGPCRQLAPMLDRLAEPLAAKVKFFKVNVDESPGLAQNFQIQAIPTVLFFKDGKLADRLTGLSSEADLKAKLDALAAGK